MYTLITGKVKFVKFATDICDAMERHLRFPRHFSQQVLFLLMLQQLDLSVDLSAASAAEE